MENWHPETNLIVTIECYLKLLGYDAVLYDNNSKVTNCLCVETNSSTCQNNFDSNGKPDTFIKLNHPWLAMLSAMCQAVPSLPWHCQFVD